MIKFSLFQLENFAIHHVQTDSSACKMKELELVDVE